MLIVDCCDKELRDRSSLFTSHNQLNIIDFGEEINQRWNVALCPWRLNLTAFVQLCRRPPSPHPSFSTGDFWCPAYQPLFPNNKRGACRETSSVHMTSSPKSLPCRRYQNHPQPRHCSRLIKLQLIHAACSKCKCLCTGSGRYRPSDASHFTENESCICCYTIRQITAFDKM